MPRKSPIDIAKGAIVAYNKKDWDGVKAAMATGFVLDEVGTERKIKGVDSVMEAYHGWAKAFPDSKAKINSASASGGTVVLELTWRGTHTGPLQTPAGEIAATGKPFEVRACQVVEVVKDKAKSTRHYFDMSTLMRQLGVMQ
jgi:steroid delta-isomerase-like uncharacterized protein